jgi:hypothetical protein
VIRIRAVKIPRSFLDRKSAYCQRVYIAGAVLLAVAPALAVEQRQNWTQCINAQHIFAPDLAIAGCTAVIQLGRETSQNQAIAFAYAGTHIERRAILIELFRILMRRSGSTPSLRWLLQTAVMSIVPRVTYTAHWQIITRRFGLTRLLRRLSPIVAACITRLESSIVRSLTLAKQSDSTPMIPSRASIVALDYLHFKM